MADGLLDMATCQLSRHFVLALTALLPAPFGTRMLIGTPWRKTCAGFDTSHELMIAIDEVAALGTAVAAREARRALLSAAAIGPGTPEILRHLEYAYVLRMQLAKGGEPIKN